MSTILFFAKTYRILFWLCLAVFLTIKPAFSEEVDVIQYIKDKDVKASATLIPDPSPGVVPTSTTEFIEFKLDEKSFDISLSPKNSGLAKADKTLSSISEGRHSASLTTLKPDKKIKDSKQLLFFYDSTPPELTPIHPAKGVTEISKNNLSFLIEFSDKGSGVPALREDIEFIATINGSDASVQVVQKDYKRLFLLDFKGKSGLKGDQSYSLFLSLKDRAGNEATFSQTYKTPPDFFEEQLDTKTCESDDGDEYDYTIQTRYDMDFPITTRVSPIVFNEIHKTEVLELSMNINIDLGDSALQSIKVTSDHPAISITRVSTKDKTAKFKITAIRPVTPNESTGLVTIECPKTISFLFEHECHDDGKSIEFTLDKTILSGDKTKFTVPVIFSWQDTTLREITTEVDDIGDFYIQYEIWSTPNAMLLDTAASYLTFQSSHYFFDEIEWRYIAQAPVEKEGYYTFEVTLATACGVWGKIQKPIIKEDHEILVNIESPIISSFYYDKPRQQLVAKLSDIGTPAEDLQINLSIDGFGERDFTLSSVNSAHELVSFFPLPTAILNANITVTDLAQNTVSSTCKIFGKPPEENTPKNPKVTKYYVKNPPAKADGYFTNPIFKNATVTKLSSNSNGFSNVRVCKKEKIFARSDFYYPDWKSHNYNLPENTFSYTEYVTYYSFDKIRRYGDRLKDIFYSRSNRYLFYIAGNSGWGMKSSEFKTYSFDLCESKVVDVSPPDVRNITFDPNTGKITAKISDHGRPVSRIKTSFYCSNTIPQYYNNHSSKYKSTFKADSKPVIDTFKLNWELYQGGSNSLHTPNYIIWNAVLESLTIEKVTRWLGVISRSNNAGKTLSQNAQNNLWAVIERYRQYLNTQEEIENSDTAPPYSDIKLHKLHGLKGKFEATLPFPPLNAGEVFDVTIYAVDESGNRGSGTLSVTIPRYPPEVTLELAGTADSKTFSSNHGTKTTSHFNTTAIDESGLDFSKMSFQLDNQAYAPLTSFGKGEIGGWVNGKNATSFTNQITSNYGHDPDIFSAQYGAHLNEGNHNATFTATDLVGLSSTAEIDFSIKYTPFITNFVTKPKAVQDVGGPAFSATILDRGGDLNLGGITFKVDQNIIDTDRLFFDPASGYFSVTGPFAYTKGYHSAEITAVDNNGNQAKDHIRFYVSDTITLPGEGQEVSLDSINIWELQNHNSNGEANPGEIIRLFPTVLNTAQIPSNFCYASLTAEDARITVESSDISTISLPASTTTTLLPGFDLAIAESILDTTIGDPYHAHLMLELTCYDSEAQEPENAEIWEMPFTLPIYRPTIPVDIYSSITIEIDHAPRTVKAGEYYLQGIAKSSASYMQSLDIRVNNEPFINKQFDRHSGKFSGLLPLRPGANIIEIEGCDKSGAVGYKTIFINCISELTVVIDKLPATTKQAVINLSGYALSSASIIEHVTLRVNGQNAPISWDKKTERFKAEVTLAEGMNILEVDAEDEGGTYGQAVSRIRYITSNNPPPPPPFSPPSVRINSPNNGAFYQCDTIKVTGNYTTGSGSLSGLEVSFPESCNVTSTSGNSFTAECETNGIIVHGNRIIEVRLTTDQGVSASDTVMVKIGSCS